MFLQDNSSLLQPGSYFIYLILSIYYFYQFTTVFNHHSNYWVLGTGWHHYNEVWRGKTTKTIIKAVNTLTIYPYYLNQSDRIWNQVHQIELVNSLGNFLATSLWWLFMRMMAKIKKNKTKVVIIRNYPAKCIWWGLCTWHMSTFPILSVCWSQRV